MTLFATPPENIPTGAYEWQTFVRRVDCAIRKLNEHVATVGKVRNAERYTVLPALAYAERIGFGHTFNSLAEVEAHIREAVDRT